MPERSAGLLIHRRRQGRTEVLLVHPGGPFWAKKDEHAWSIPKGLVDADEDDRAAARREVREETGLDIEGEFVPLGEFRQPGGKIVIAWAVAADPEVGAVASNMFSMEWPPHSGRMQDFPEIDKAEWFGLDEAETKIHKGQKPVLDRLRTILNEA